MCGAPKCRGTMDANPERRRDYLRRVEIYWEGDGAWYPGGRAAAAAAAAAAAGVGGGGSRWGWV